MIGLLYSTSPSGMAFFVTAFRNGLKQSGYIEGQNIAFQYRWGEGQTDRLAALATDLEQIPLRFEHSLHGERSSYTLLPRNRQRSVRSGAIDAEWCARRPCAGQPSLC